MRRTLLALSIAAAALPVLAAESVKATVNGMFCTLCAQGIEKRLSKLPSTKSVFVDLKQRIVAVQAKDGQQIDGKAITAAIADAGYEVVKLEPSQKTVAEIKAEIQAKK